MAKTKRRILTILVLFAGMAVLVVLAHLRPRYDHLVQESPEMTEKRLDRENNAYYALQEAASLLPDLPPAMIVEDEDGFAYLYRSKRGSLGTWLNIDRPDNDPMLIEYLERSRSACALALQACDKSYCLRPPPPEDEHEAFMYWHAPPYGTLESQFRQLVTIILAEALINPCSDDPEIDACRHLFDAWNLMSLMASETIAPFGNVFSAGMDVARKASPAHQARLVEWMAQRRSEWTPPHGAINESIRLVFSRKAVPGQALLEIRLAWPEKRMVLRFEKELREVLAMTYVQYEGFLLGNPRFSGYEPTLFAPVPDHFLWYNSHAIAAMDGLSIVLALERFKHDNGRYPDLIEALAPEYLDELPSDPFDGRPYMYQTVEDDYVLRCREERPFTIYPTDWRVTH